MRATFMVMGVLALAAALPSAAVGYENECSNSAAFGTDLPGIDMESPTPPITCSVTYRCPASANYPCWLPRVIGEVFSTGQAGVWLSWSGGLALCDGGTGGCRTEFNDLSVEPGTQETFNCGVRQYIAANIRLHCYWDTAWL